MELYDTGKDFSQAENLAAQHPEKLRELQELFLTEAAKYNVFPLDDRSFERAKSEIAGRPDLMVGRTSMTVYPGMRMYEVGAAPNLKNKSFTLTANVEVSESGADGVIYANGNHLGGLSFYLKNGKPKLCYNWFGLEKYEIESPEAVPTGKHSVRFHFAYDGGGIGKGGTGTLHLDDRKVGEGRIEKTMPFIFSIDSVDVGQDGGMPVADDYTANAFTGGQLSKVRVDFGDDDHSHQEEPEHHYNRHMGRQ